MLLFNILLSYCVPFIIWFVWKKKANPRTFPLIVGMISYMFISVLRGVARIFILNESTSEHVWLYNFLSALLSGVFEEVGRYVVFKYCIPNHDRWTDCITYGIGHGAIEVFLTSVPENNIYLSLYGCFIFTDAILFSVSMSIMVFSTVHHTDRKTLLWIAIGLHMIVDIIPALLINDIFNMTGYDFTTLVYLIGVCWLGYKVFRYFNPKELPDESDDFYY